MEHREPPRISSGDLRTEVLTADATDRVPLSVRKWRKPLASIGYRRAILFLAGLVAAGAILIYLGLRGVRAAVGWLTVQPAYQVRFRDIGLVPGPPDWYRKGSVDFLESVRQCAEESETLPVLDLEPGRIKLSFERSPWIEQVLKVSYPPRGLRVELQYREPVALVDIPRSHHKYLLDENARILPLMDVDVDGLLRLGSIIRISGDDLVEPLDPRPKHIWESRPGVHDAAAGIARIPGAARLASYLVQRIRLLDPSRPMALEIVPTDPPHWGWFLWDAGSRPILWGQAPGEEPPGEMSAEEKWTMLRHWSREDPKRLERPPGYWRFTKGGVRYHELKVPR